MSLAARHRGGPGARADAGSDGASTNTDEVAAHGGIPLDVIQKYINLSTTRLAAPFRASCSRSTQARCNYLMPVPRAVGEKERRRDDHACSPTGRRAVDLVQDGGHHHTPDGGAALLAVNHYLRSE